MSRLCGSGMCVVRSGGGGVASVSISMPVSAAEAAVAVALSAVLAVVTSGEGGATRASRRQMRPSLWRRQQHAGVCVEGRKIYARQWEGRSRPEWDPCQHPNQCRRRERQPPRRRLWYPQLHQWRSKRPGSQRWMRPPLRRRRSWEEPLPRSRRPSRCQHEVLDGGRRHASGQIPDGTSRSRKGHDRVGDGGDGLARSKGWRVSLCLCHLRMVSTGGRRQARPLMGSTVSRRGTTVGDGGDGDGLVRSRGRRPGLRHLELATMPVCA